MRVSWIAIGALIAATVAGTAGCQTGGPDLNALAERYVQVILGMGAHDPDYVDAYYGDPGLKPAVPVPLETLARDARSLRDELGRVVLPPDTDELTRLLRAYLDRQLAAVEARIAMLRGERLSFDEESRRLYDAEAPHHTTADFQQVLDRLDELIPGRGPLAPRYARFRDRFVIPSDRLDAVFRAAIDECRARTRAHITLPPGESFTVEYVTGKSWSAYNWYQGDFRSLIQVNTELPITIDRAIDLACHEGYPGHHVYNVLLEQQLVRERGWIEFTVYPLFSPQSLIAEGTANAGIEVAFPGEERTAFERDTLYPLAGLDPANAALFAAVQKDVEALSYAGNEAARQYLDGAIDRAETVEWLGTWAMMPRERAEQRVKFFDQYRSYVINYNLGRDLVRGYLARRGGTAERPDVLWREFAALLSSPRLPSGLQQEDGSR